MFLLGIIDVARLLFAYSVVSNAAQEGSRYGVTRPRDMLDPNEATQVALNATRTPTAERRRYTRDQVVPAGSCSIFTRTREKAFGLNRSDINISAWYDRGDDTPVRVPNSTATPYLQVVAVPGNRVIVEATYRFNFIVPFLSVFRPNGIDIKMRSARTIMNDGGDTNYQCLVNYTPAPTFTHTSTPTSTSTPTITSTPTATPVCGLRNGYACRVNSPSGNAEPWQAQVLVEGYSAGDYVRAEVESSGRGGNMTCTVVGNLAVCSYASSAGNENALPTDVIRIIWNHSGGSGCSLQMRINFTSLPCLGVPTWTPMPTFTGTSTRTATATRTPTMTPLMTSTFTRTPTRTATVTGTPPTATRTPSVTQTSTPTTTSTPTGTPTITPTYTATPTYTVTSTPTITPTPTATPVRRLVIADHRPRKPSGSNRPLDERVLVTDDLGVPVTGASVSASVSGPNGRTWSGKLTNMGGGVYQTCGAGTYNNGTIVVIINATKVGYQSTSDTATASNGSWCP
jgi:hypothetical protein